MLRNADKDLQRSVENSAYYQGYKLLWVMMLLLKGKKIPIGFLTEWQFRNYTYNIVDFVTDTKNLEFLLDFDSESSEAFFNCIVYLFSEKPRKYLQNLDGYQL